MKQSNKERVFNYFSDEYSSIGIPNIWCESLDCLKCWEDYWKYDDVYFFFEFDNYGVGYRTIPEFVKDFARRCEYDRINEARIIEAKKELDLEIDVTYRVERMKKENVPVEEINKHENEFEDKIGSMKDILNKMFVYNNGKIKAFLRGNEYYEGSVIRSKPFGLTSRFFITVDEGKNAKGENVKKKYMFIVSYHPASINDDRMNDCEKVFCLDALDPKVAEKVLKYEQKKLKKNKPHEFEKRSEEDVYKGYNYDRIENERFKSAVNSKKRNDASINILYEQIEANPKTIAERMLTLAGIDIKYAK